MLKTGTEYFHCLRNLNGQLSCTLYKSGRSEQWHDSQRLKADSLDGTAKKCRITEQLVKNWDILMINISRPQEGGGISYSPRLINSSELSRRRLELVEKLQEDDNNAERALLVAVTVEKSVEEFYYFIV